MTKAVNQLAAGQRAAGGLNNAARSPIVVHASGGPSGPAFIPQLNGRTVSSTLMRDAVASQVKFIRRNVSSIVGELSPFERNFLSLKLGGDLGIARRLAMPRIASFKQAMKLNPVDTYHNIFTSQG